MAQVVLLHPTGGYWEVFRDALNLPLNLMMAASYLKDHYTVSIIDQRLGPEWRKRLEEDTNSDTLCAGVTTYTGPSIKNALDMCREVRSLNRNIPIVWGGIHVTLLPAQSLKNPLVDLVVLGEGEETFRKLVDCFANGDSPSGIPGILCKPEDAEKISIPDFLDIDILPPLPYDLVDINKYLPRFRNTKHLNLQTSRGCPMNCGFCYNTAFNRNTWRAMSVEKTMECITEPIERFNVNNILFVDDNFFVDMERAKVLMCKMCDLNIQWQSQGIDIATLMKMPDGMLQLMVDSGCRRLALGVESGSSRIRNMLGKPGNRNEIIEQVARLKKYNIITHCTFIIGFPNETRREVLETHNLMLDLMRANENVRTPFLFLYIPNPGTEIFKYALSKGFVPPENLEDWNDINADDFSHERWRFPLGENVTERFLKNLSFITHFLDIKAQDYNAPLLIRILSAIYKPFAWLRARYLFLGVMPEKLIFKFLTTYAARKRWG